MAVVSACYHFYLHTEHHLFLTTPWHWVPALRRRLKQVEIPHFIEVEFLAFVREIRAGDPCARRPFAATNL